MQNEKEKMCRASFEEELQRFLLERLGVEYRTEISRVRKNNGVMKEVLYIRKENSECVPCFYLDELYRSYCMGEHTEGLAEHLANIVLTECEEVRQQINVYLSKEWIVKHLFLRLVSAKENEELMLRLKQGDKEARERFIVGNMRLVLSLVKRFRTKNLGQDDVFQAGCVGLIKAINNFDTGVGVKFSTYAVPMIVGEMKRFLRDGNSLRVSRSIRDTAYKVLKAREAIEARDEEATIGKIAAEMGVTEREVAYALDAISDPVSIYEPVYNKSGDTLLLMDQLCDEKNTDEIWTEHVALSEAMEKLGEREKKILFLRYYEGKTQTEISEEVGISQAQVSRLEKNAIENIRSNIS